MNIKELEKLFKALGNKRRLQIIKLLFKEGEQSVSEIAGTLKFSFKATSKHLHYLLNTNVLDREQRHKSVHYKISNSTHDLIKTLIRHIHHSGE